MEIPKKTLNDGTSIPVIGLGSWMHEGKEAEDSIRMGWDVGYRHFDTAQQYENHQAVGAALKGKPREEFYLATKLQWDFLEPELVEPNCDKCLQELGMDYIDLFLIHWPNRRKNMTEVVRAMHKLKEKGKIKSVGVCNFTSHHIQDLYDNGLDICINQVEFHPYMFQKKLLDFCHNHHIEMTAYCPLAHGKIIEDEHVLNIAEKHGKTPAQVCLAWLLAHGLIMIPKGSSKDHLIDNLGALSFQLDAEDMERIDQLNTGERICAPEIHEFDY